MEKVYFIEGLDCANCAAKLERHLKEISEFDSVIIDFMAQKLLISVKDEDSLQMCIRDSFDCFYARSNAVNFNSFYSICLLYTSRCV